MGVLNIYRALARGSEAYSYYLCQNPEKLPMTDFRRILYPRARVSQQRLRECFAGRWVVVTGATSGIGLALTRLLIGAGANLYLIARREEVLSSLRDEARKQGCEVDMMAVDLRDREALQRVVADMQERLPRVDYFFCNAGKSIHRKIEDALERMHDYDRTMDLNYRALVALSLSLMPLLKMGEARIVYTSSVSTLYPAAPGWSAYHASKSAANVWCETADAELRKQGVRVQVAYMPLVHTPMSDVNEQYKHLPGYTAEEAAMQLLKLSMGKCRSYKPWWARITAPVAQLLSPVVRFVYRRL